jgi:hypothetical protein
VLSGGADGRFGFDAVWARMGRAGADLEGDGSDMEKFWRVVLKRLEGTGDLELVALRYVALWRSDLIHS